jgi:1-acyl-sn-glycerol-3-phosphate acyltransferase
VTRGCNSHDSQSTVVVCRPAADAPARERVRNRAGAVRGTSAYLGSKGSNLQIYAKRLGRAGETAATSAEKTASLAKSMATGWDTAPEAPRLYHGLPSGEEQEEIPVESAKVIHSLETELSALEGRLQRRGPFDPTPSRAAASSRSGATPAQHAVAVPEGSSGEDLPSLSCDPNARWDDFGRDARSLERFGKIATFLAKRYFRTVVTGIEHIPPTGPCLLVANHSGALPIDGLVLMSALWHAHPEQRHVRWLTEDFVQNLPFVGTYLQRLGAVRASRENALRLLRNGECVVAFPEGFKGYAKPVAQWYHVQRLGRGRIVGMCLEAGVPLLPCAIVGAEEATPSLRRLEAVERWLGTPYFPITPTFPWLGPIGLLPAPTRWLIDIGPAFLTGHESARADDPLYIAQLTARLRNTLQQRLDRLVSQRKSTWFG